MKDSLTFFVSLYQFIFKENYVYHLFVVSITQGLER